jgi:hypothetical protein
MNVIVGIFVICVEVAFVGWIVYLIRDDIRKDRAAGVCPWCGRKR